MKSQQDWTFDPFVTSHTVNKYVTLLYLLIYTYRKAVTAVQVTASTNAWWFWSKLTILIQSIKDKCFPCCACIINVHNTLWMGFRFCVQPTMDLLSWREQCICNHFPPTAACCLLLTNALVDNINKTHYHCLSLCCYRY